MVGEQERARQKAYRLLALRARSQEELGAKLRASGFSVTAVAEALAHCRELGYLDDARYARQRARDLAVNRLSGDRKIAADLKTRGIPEPLCREAIAAARAEIGAGEAIGRLLAKRGISDPLGLERRERESLIRSLMGKGFPRGLIFSMLKSTEEDGFHDDDGE